MLYITLNFLLYYVYLNSFFNCEIICCDKVLYIYIRILISKSILLKARSYVKLFIVTKFKLLFHNCIYIYIKCMYYDCYY